MKSPLKKLVKKHPALYKELASFYIESGDTRKAKNALTQYIKTFPDDHSGLIVKGLLEERLKHYDDAELIYRVILNADPRNIKALSRLVSLENMKKSPSDFWRKRLFSVDPLSPLVKDMLEKSGVRNLPPSFDSKPTTSEADKPAQETEVPKAAETKPKAPDKDLLSALAKQFNLDEDEAEEVELIFRDGKGRDKAVEDASGEDASETEEEQDIEEIEDLSESEEEEDESMKFDPEKEGVESLIRAMKEEAEEPDTPKPQPKPEDIDRGSIEALLAELKSQSEGEVETLETDSEAEEAELKELEARGFDEEREPADTALTDHEDDSIDSFISQAAEESELIIRDKPKDKFDAKTTEQETFFEEELEADSVGEMIDHMETELGKKGKQIKHFEGGEDSLNELIKKMDAKGEEEEVEEDEFIAIDETPLEIEDDEKFEEVEMDEHDSLEELVAEEYVHPEIEEESKDKKVVLLDPDTGQPVEDEEDTEDEIDADSEEGIKEDEKSVPLSTPPVFEDKVDELVTAFREIDNGKEGKTKEPARKKFYSTTLAELFASQGNFEKALSIYNSFPDDIKAEHTDRIKELEDKIKNQ